MGAYYNEHDPKAAAWLRELIVAGLIAPGDVDERSIEDVCPTDVREFVQCHWFAGIAVWSYALRRAGWPDDRPVWTGSCPCQPFSSAGQGAGFADERHLWPAWFHLISQCRPAAVFGEQVASSNADPWIDLVHDDMEALGYAFGAVPFPSAGVGAPHIRDRLYWHASAGVTLGDASGARLEGHGGHGRERYGPGRIGSIEAGSVAAAGSARLTGDTTRGGFGERGDEAFARSGGHTDGTGGSPSGVADTGESERRRWPVDGALLANGPEGQRQQGTGDAERNSGLGRLADAAGARGRRLVEDGNAAHLMGALPVRSPESGRGGAATAAGPVNGLWRAADWLLCRDGKWRPVEPSTFPLVNAGTYRNRVAELRGAGNAINLAAAQTFIESVIGDTA